MRDHEYTIFLCLISTFCFMPESWIRDYEGWSTAWLIIAVSAMIIGAVTEIVRTRTPRAWYHDLDKRIELLDARIGVVDEKLDDVRQELRTRIEALETTAHQRSRK